MVRSRPEEEELTRERPVPAGKPLGRARCGWRLGVQEEVSAPFPLGLFPCKVCLRKVARSPGPPVAWQGEAGSGAHCPEGGLIVFWGDMNLLRSE